MSLRDRLRGMRSGGETLREYDASADPVIFTSAEISEFTPRQDGDYRNAAAGLFLRFARPVVTETDTAIAEVAHGEFTTAGRFTVQRRFGRPIVYTVLDGSDDALTVRRTDTATREAAQLEFTFEADGEL